MIHLKENQNKLMGRELGLPGKKEKETELVQGAGDKGKDVTDGK